MSDIPTAIAELGQGALTVRAVEPAAGESGGSVEGGEGHTHESACLNCCTRLIGSHCHACGQAAHVHRTIAAFFHDLAHGVFHVEGKVLRTLPLLAWHPGRLTRQYIDGRRASYVSPIALFLFAVFLLFGSIHLLEGSASDATIVSGSPGAVRTTLDTLHKQRAAARTPAEATAIDRRIASTRAALDAVDGFDLGPEDTTGTPREVHSDVPMLAHAVNVFRANPALALYKLESSAYKYSWLLIPLSVPMLWLLFPFSRRFHLYDHTVFVTYSLTFMTLLAIVYMAADKVRLPFAAMLLLLAPVHMYRQLRGTYATGRAATLWRTAALGGFAFVALIAFTLLLLTIELAG